ncbi:hypothetical protein KC357_g108 [Hortaea werneckii]|nr:hypothetical protein KC357_g108 [Hortaea werneckii]
MDEEQHGNRSLPFAVLRHSPAIAPFLPPLSFLPFRMKTLTKSVNTKTAPSKLKTTKKRALPWLSKSLGCMKTPVIDSALFMTSTHPSCDTTWNRMNSAPPKLSKSETPYIHPRSRDQHNAVDEAPRAAEEGVGRPPKAIRDDFDDCFDRKKGCETHVGEREPVEPGTLIRMLIEVLPLKEGRGDASQHNHGDDGEVDERRKRVPDLWIGRSPLDSLSASSGTDNTLTKLSDGVLRAEEVERDVVLWMPSQVLALRNFPLLGSAHDFLGQSTWIEFFSLIASSQPLLSLTKSVAPLLIPSVGPPASPSVSAIRSSRKSLTTASFSNISVAAEPKSTCPGGLKRSIPSAAETFEPAAAAFVFTREKLVHSQKGVINGAEVDL